MTNFQFLKSKKIFFVASAVVLLAAGCNQKQVTSDKQQAANNQKIANSGQQTQAQDKTIQIFQTVEGSNLNKPEYQIAEGKTAMDLLKASHQVATKEYSGIGEFVESIDGNKPDSKHFWEFFVNGKSSNVGASSYILKAGDKIEWKLTEITASSGQ